MEPTDELRQAKRTVRAEAERRRAALANRDQLSRAIWDRFVGLPQYPAATTVMLYVDLGSEVQTQPFLPSVIEAGKRVVVPYCVDRELELFYFQSMDELAIGTYGILEPRIELRAASGRRIDVAQLDLAMVPGVAFDRRGGRVGHGKGYYDRLLPHLRPDALRVGVAFECQLFDEAPMGDRDAFVDLVITEADVYERPR